MCVKPYYAWRCGHRDLSATELPVQPCGPPDRYPHEPLCSPLTYQVIVRKVPEQDGEGEDDAQVPREEWEEDICPACCEVYSRVDQQWYTRKAALIRSGVAIERHLEIIDERLHNRTIAVLEKGQSAGPDHTLHLDEYELEQVVILRDMDRLLSNVERTKDYFLDSYRRIKNQGQLPDDFVFGCMRKYARAEQRRMELSQEQTDQFVKTVHRCVDELNTALINTIASPQEAVAVCQSIKAAEPEDEAEPEGEAEPSNT